MVCSHILIAVQSDIQREGLRAIFRKHFPNCTIQTVIKSSDFFDLFNDHSHAICLFSAKTVDVEVDTFVGKLHKINHHKKTVLMVPDLDTLKIEGALRAGINGLFTQHCTSDELIKIITEVSSGRNCYSTDVSDAVMINYHERRLQRPRSKKRITKREDEILSLIVKGYTSAEIAKKLFISPRTVETHRCNLMGKLKLRNTADLVRFALQEKIF